MSNTEFIWRYLPFWVANYGLAVVMWSCVGRFMLAFILPRLQPSNYIWRAFVFLSGWAVTGTTYITPSFVKPFLLPILAAFWVYVLRIVLFLLLFSWGMTPRVTPQG